MKSKFLVFLFVGLIATSVTLVGCDNDNDVERAADNMGDALRDTADDTGDMMRDAADNVKDATN